MTDLLVQRLKAAKRELTALKTAHRRGLGGLMVYEYPLKLSGYDDKPYILNVKIDFSPDTTSYPFIICSPEADPETYQSNADIISMDYANGGMSAEYSFDWFSVTQLSPYTIYFLSSAPIANVTTQFWS